MTTSTALIQSLIEKISAVLANTEFAQTHATQAVLLAEAKLKLETSASLEGEVLASIQAILNTFAAQGAAQRDTLAAAKVAVDNARDAVILQGANIQTLVNRADSNFAIGVGYPALTFTHFISDQANRDYSTARILRNRIYDRRTKKLWMADKSSAAQGLSLQNASLFVASLDKDGYSVALGSNSMQTNYSYEVSWFLPLAKSASDSTATLTLSTAGNPSEYTNGYSRQHTVFTVMGQANAWVAANVAVKPFGVFWAFDKTNKTLVFLSAPNTVSTSGEPDETAKTYELFADGSTRLVAAAAAGWKGFNAYVASDVARFIWLQGSNSPTDVSWSSSWAQVSTVNPLVTPTTAEGQYTSSPPRVTYIPSNSTESFPAPRAVDGSFMVTKANAPDIGFVQNLRMNNRDRLVDQFSRTGGSVRTPMWVIETDGSVALYHIHYTPDVVSRVDYSTVSGGTTNQMSQMAIKGYHYAVVGPNRTVVKSGYAPSDGILKLMNLSGYPAQADYVGAFWPAGVHLDDDLLQSFVGVQTLKYTSGSQQPYTETNASYGGTAFLTIQKIVR